MLPTALQSLISEVPSLHHLATSADEETWGLGAGFPILLFNAGALNEDAFVELSDSFDDGLSELDVVLFDEEDWKSSRYLLIGLAGVFDSDDEQLHEAYPFVDQMDGLLLWDCERSAVVLMGSDMGGEDSFEEAVVCVADSAEAFLADLDKA